MKVYGFRAGIYYFLNDHLGTPHRLLNGDGRIVWHAAYLPFGETVLIKEEIQNPFRFPGQYFDEETGLHYNYHRYYDPKIGRYLRADPIGQAEEINLFAYAQNNPTCFSDPLGLWTFTYDAGAHAPTGPWPVAAGLTVGSELVDPLSASGKLEARDIRPEATVGVWGILVLVLVLAI